MLGRGISWVVPPSQDASHHQDFLHLQLLLGRGTTLGTCISNETFGCWRYVRKMMNNHVPMSFIVMLTIVWLMMYVYHICVCADLKYIYIYTPLFILIFWTFWTIGWGIWFVYVLRGLELLCVPPILCLRARSIPSIDQSMFPSQRDGCFSVEKQLGLPGAPKTSQHPSVQGSVTLDPIGSMYGWYIYIHANHKDQLKCL